MGFNYNGLKSYQKNIAESMFRIFSGTTFNANDILVRRQQCNHSRSFKGYWGYTQGAGVEVIGGATNGWISLPNQKYRLCF